MHTPTRDIDSSTDLSALAWVHDELRRSLDAAHKSLRRFVKESEAMAGADVDAVDPSVLRSARAQIHQGVGALELVGLSAAAALLRASEAAVQRYVSKPGKLTSLAVDDIEKASFALLDYLSRLLAGTPISPLSLFPQYRAVQEIAGADRIHPADLWTVDWQWHDLPADPTAVPRQADAATQSALEQQMLTMMRGASSKVFARMSDIFAGLGEGAAKQTQTASMWKLAAAAFEAQATGLLKPDVYSKRLASRLLSQLRIVAHGDSNVSERLAQDILFFCAQAASPGVGHNAPRLSVVRQYWRLSQHPSSDYSSSSLGRFDPAWLAQARKRVAAAKDSWSAVAGAEMHRLAGLAEQFSLVGDSLKRLFPSGEVLANELQQAVIMTQHSGAAPTPPLAMEVATSLLYVEACLEDGELDTEGQAQRVQRLAQRLSAVRQGAVPEPLEPWIEDLYRRVSDRQTMGSVVQELRASLSDAEKQIDLFFRDPTKREVLVSVPNQLSSMRGVLSVLGMDQAAAALLRMRDEVDGLASTEVDVSHIADAGVFDRLAGNLGALGFLIDMLSVQPNLVKSLFVYDPQTGVLAPVMGRGKSAPGEPQRSTLPQVESRLIEQVHSLALNAVRDDVPLADVTRDLERLSQEAHAADQPGLAAMASTAQSALQQAHDNEDAASAVRGDVSEALADFVNTASGPVGLDSEPAPAAAAAPRTAPPPSSSLSLEEDTEMRDIFLEEAREVLETARNALGMLREAPGELAELTTLRRAFHTLKGSSRMVGLLDFGDAAWTGEQIYNTRLAEPAGDDSALMEFTQWSLDHLAQWVDDIAAGRDAHRKATTMAQAAEALKGAAPPMLLESQSAVTRPAALQSPAASPLPVESLLSQIDLSLGSPPKPAAAAAFLASTPSSPASEPELSLPPLSLQAEQQMAAHHAAQHEDKPEEMALDLSSLDDAAQDADIPSGSALELPDVSELPEVSEAPDVAPLPAQDKPGWANTDFPLMLEAFEHLNTEPQALDSSFGSSRHGALDTIESIEMIEIDLVDFSDEVASAVPPAGEEAPAADLSGDLLNLDVAVPGAGEAAEEQQPSTEAQDEAAADAGTDSAQDDDQVKWVGPLRISLPLFNIYLNEADELSRRLTTELAEWSLELHQPISENAVALAHSLAGSSATVGFADLSHLARALEHAEMRTQAIGRGTAEEATLFGAVAEEIRHLLHQFAAGFLKEPDPELLRRLAEHEISSAKRLEEAAAAQELAALESGRGPLEELDPAAEAPRAVDSAWASLPSEAVLDALGRGELKPLAALAVDANRSAVLHATAHEEGEEDIDAVDAVDIDLFPIFEEEAQELLPQLSSQMRAWAAEAGDKRLGSACMRTLHTLKGGARLAGAMRLGELAHRLETRIERVMAMEEPQAADVAALESRADALTHTFDALRARDAASYASAVEQAEQAALVSPAVEARQGLSGLMPLAALPEAPPPLQPMVPTAFASEKPAQAKGKADEAAAPQVPVADDGSAALSEVDWSRFANAAVVVRNQAGGPGSGATSSVRVSAPLLDRLVNEAGEVSITRARIESEVSQMRGTLGDLTDNLERLRMQLRDIELQGETQMSSRLEAAKAADQSFDPLEFDRFTRFQELTRMMAESVNDVATVQRTLQRTVEGAEDELAAQARLTRNLQDDLLRTRMVEFEGLSDRLYRVVRQAAKETGKQVRLDIVGGSIEVDRGVLDRMTGAFEHLLRNSVTHGVELPAVRQQAGKDPIGSIAVALSQEGNEVSIEFRDDGAGLDLKRIRDKGQAMGLLQPGTDYPDADLANLIFTPGFSTADKVTELAGRGIGMDVVRSEVNAMGGRIETATSLGQGTSFKLQLPLTTAVTQVVMLRCGNVTVAVPSNLVEIVRRASSADVDKAYASGTYTFGDRPVAFFWLGALLQVSAKSVEAGGRMRLVVVVRSAQQRVAVHVDEVLGNQEVVVKNLGPQLSRMPGLAGMTLLASGGVALIYNPVALATLYGESARAATYSAFHTDAPEVVVPVVTQNTVPAAPLVLVVDDSLTVRRVTQRLLVREGYRVVLAKDGLEALEVLADEKPRVVLSDIEMPRMDGFDLLRNIRGDQRLKDLPVIMITSRIAQKHRDYAVELGVDHYLGKPYSEDELLALVSRYTTVNTLA
jgi:chemosensory pili system protein ChpA (sensor histidine kinase/response regulator)